MSTRSFRQSSFFRFSAFTVLVAFTGFLPAQPVYSQVAIMMPPVGQMVHVTQHFEPPQMVGLKIDLKNPFSFGFIMDQGESPMGYDVKKEEFNKIIKYFLVSLAMPNKDMWVNLSPYESKRIIPEVFGQTEMGRDLLAQDYVLKQFTASLMYPEDGLGKTFWNKIYQESQARFGTTDINVNTFNKVWIVADHADVYQKGDTAFLVGSHLKVMLEQDYMAIEQNKEQFGDVSAVENTSSDAKTQMASQIVREIIIPAIEKEVNEGQSFAAVRQIYNAEIMATWFKKTLRESLLGQVFANKSKIAGQMASDPQAKEKIFMQYLQAYKRGVFNYIKKEATPDGQIIPRRYLSGGVVLPESVQGSTDRMFQSLAQQRNQAVQNLAARLDREPIETVIADRLANATSFNSNMVEGVALGVAQLPLSDEARERFMAALVSHLTRPNMPAPERQNHILRLAQELQVQQNQPSAVQDLWPAVKELIKKEMGQETPSISNISAIPDARALATAMANISLPPQVTQKQRNELMATLIHHLTQQDPALLTEVNRFQDQALVAQRNERLSVADADFLPEGQPGVEHVVKPINVAEGIVNTRGVSREAREQGLVNLIAHLGASNPQQQQFASALSQAKDEIDMMNVVRRQLSTMPQNIINRSITPTEAIPMLGAIAAPSAIQMPQASLPEMADITVTAVHQFAQKPINEGLLRVQFNRGLVQGQKAAIGRVLADYFASSPVTRNVTPMNLAGAIVNMPGVSPAAKKQSLLNLITHLRGSSTNQDKLAFELGQAQGAEEILGVVRNHLSDVQSINEPLTAERTIPMLGAMAAMPTAQMTQANPEEIGRVMAHAVHQFVATPINEQAFTAQVNSALAQGQQEAMDNLIRDQFAENRQMAAPAAPGGINLSDEHLTMNIKVDGAGMPLAPQYQDPAMLNFNGLVSYIRSITPITQQNVPALFELAK